MTASKPRDSSAGRSRPPPRASPRPSSRCEPSPSWRAQRARVDCRTSQARSTVSSPSADWGRSMYRRCADDNAEHRVAQEFEPLV